MDAVGFESIFSEELRKLDITKSPGGMTRDQIKAEIDGLKEPLAALCLSGGGIRSAAFALGVLQGLARFNLLGQFHYLSTVSGGGYIGSWLSAWRYHKRKNTPPGTAQDVFEHIDRTKSQSGVEAKEIIGLRADSNYLTPKLGVLSADTWTVIAIFVRNIVLNWLVFLPLFMGLLYFPMLCEMINEWLHSHPIHPDGSPYQFAWLMRVGLVATTAGLVVASYGRRSASLSGAGFISGALFPILIAAIAFTAYAAVGENLPRVRVGALVGASCYLLAWLVASLFLLRRPSQSVPHLIGDAGAWILCGAVSGGLLAVGMRLGQGMDAIFPLVPKDPTKAVYTARWLTIFGVSWTMLSIFGGELLYVGLRSYSKHGDMDREWLGRADGWLSAAAVSWALIAAVSLLGPHALEQLFIAIASMGGISGILALGFGNSAKTAATDAKEIAGWLSLDTIVSATGLIFAVFLAICISWLDVTCGAWIDAHPAKFLTDEYGWLTMWMVDGVGAVILVLFAFLTSYAVNVNRFSLHAIYRNRLIRAFLGSARATASPRRKSDPFTGFDPDDNVPMSELSTDKPLHLINITLNVVASKNLAWQERKAEPFSVTPLAAGNENVGYRKTKEYGDRQDGITLGTAMAISGAAVSPNMGYNSSPLIGFLLMLFNIRLGWWLGNPKRRSFRREGPTLSAVPLLEELAGKTNDEGRWVYLSDGGHFENLGLYEMVRRRCRIIVVSDAGCDPECAYEDLANAARKIYIDQGVSIDFDAMDLSKRQTPPKLAAYCAVGTITYPGSSIPGWILYIKPGYHGNEPVHIKGYANAHRSFPHQTTANQFFTESQFEAYRGLGAHITELICSGGDGGVVAGHNPCAIKFPALKTQADKYLVWVASQLKADTPIHNDAPHSDGDLPSG